MAMKTGLAKLEETEAAWETHAANDKFYDTTLTQYKATVQLVRDADTLIASLKQQMTAAKNQKKDRTRDALTLERNVVRGIGGDPKHGQDSDLWEGTGRVRSSERQTGLTKKKKGEDK